MRFIGTYALCAALSLLGATDLAAQDVYVYPTKNQSAEQMWRDKAECHDWAVGETGVDPAKIATEAQSKSGGGALGGAAVGAARGAVSGEAGAGAMQGVGIGRLVHAIRARRQMEEQQQAQAKEQQQQQAQLQKYDRAFGACLTGRGYTVQ
jgi:hypothetical protein